MTTHTRGACDTIAHPAMKKSPHKISTMPITSRIATVRQKRGNKRWREPECKREERIGARELGKAQDTDPQNGQRGVENERNEKIPLEQKPAIRSASGPSPAPRSARRLNSSWPPAMAAA